MTIDVCEHGRPNHIDLIGELMRAMGREPTAQPRTPVAVWRDLLDEVGERFGVAKPMTDAVFWADVKLRIENGQSVCLGEHHVADAITNDDAHAVIVSCGADVLDRLVLPRLATDQSHEIQVFVAQTFARHDRYVAGRVIAALLATLRPDQQAEAYTHFRETP